VANKIPDVKRVKREGDNRQPGVRVASLDGGRLRRLSERLAGLNASGASRLETGRFMARYVWTKLPLLWQGATTKLNSGRVRSSIKAQLPADKPVILVHTLGGGIGDNIVIARFLRDLGAECGPLEFDVACNSAGAARWVFESIPGFRDCHSSFLFREIAPLYAVAIRITQVAEVCARDERQLALNPKLAAVCRRLEAFIADNAALVAELPCSSGDFGRRAVYANQTRSSYLHYQAGIAHGGEGFSLRQDEAVLGRLGLAGKDYVTVHNGFDAAFVVSGQTSTKTYPRFDEALALLKAQRPNLTIVQLGTPETSAPLVGADVSLVGKTSLAEAAALIGGSKLHLDVDSGLAHIASVIGAKALVLFGPSDADYFGYSQNRNLHPAFCGGCWWINESWMDRCPRGFSEARCMTSHQPSDVVREAIALLDHRGVQGMRSLPRESSRAAAPLAAQP